MVSVRLLLGAGAASLISVAAFAADMPQPPPPPPQVMYVPQPVVMEQPMGNWYLRGDIGVGIQNFSTFDHTQGNSAFVWPSTWSIVQQDIQDTTIFGAGFGYQFNSWLRTDLTGEYRTKAMWKATGTYSGATCNAGVGNCFDYTEGNLSSAVIMANLYLDLGTWWCLTPYVGAGVGGAFNRITDVQDNGVISDGTVGFGLTSGDSGAWSAAWNIQTGLAYNVTNNFKVDFNVRYLHLGSPETATVICQNTGPGACPNASYTLTDTNSWDFRIGLRWLLQPDAAPSLMPQPVQVPMQMQPMQAPMPLMSRG